MSITFQLNMNSDAQTNILKFSKKPSTERTLGIFAIRPRMGKGSSLRINATQNKIENIYVYRSLANIKMEFTIF